VERSLIIAAHVAGQPVESPRRSTVSPSRRFNPAWHSGEARRSSRAPRNPRRGRSSRAPARPAVSASVCCSGVLRNSRQRGHSDQRFLSGGRCGSGCSSHSVYNNYHRNVIDFRTHYDRGPYFGTIGVMGEQNRQKDRRGVSHNRTGLFGKGRALCGKAGRVGWARNARGTCGGCLPSGHSENVFDTWHGSSPSTARAFGFRRPILPRSDVVREYPCFSVESAGP